MKPLERLFDRDGLPIFGLPAEILTEGGPLLVGQLLEEGLIDELFLTTSLRLFGRPTGDERKSLVEEFDLGGRSLRLLSVRRHVSHLFLRYSL